MPRARVSADAAREFHELLGEALYGLAGALTERHRLNRHNRPRTPLYRELIWRHRTQTRKHPPLKLSPAPRRVRLRPLT